MGLEPLTIWILHKDIPIEMGINITYYPSYSEMVCKIVTITMPEDQLKDIDKRRGDVTRSTFISKRLKESLSGKDAGGS